MDLHIDAEYESLRCVTSLTHACKRVLWNEAVMEEAEDYETPFSHLLNGITHISLII